jgi:hypothetical protein
MEPEEETPEVYRDAEGVGYPDGMTTSRLWIAQSLGFFSIRFLSTCHSCCVGLGGWEDLVYIRRRPPPLGGGLQAGQEAPQALPPSGSSPLLPAHIIHHRRMIE